MAKPAFLLVFAAFFGFACNTDSVELDLRQCEIRPTDGDGWYGNGYGDVEVLSYESLGGQFRIFYTLESRHAVPDDDEEPANGIPDYVESLGGIMDEIWVAYIDDMGYRQPPDDAIYHDFGQNDWGGDSRYDIYLQNIEQNDGYRVVEGCTEQPEHCAGYMVIENDFVGFSYPSTEIAFKVLGAHEFFHVVQDGYDADADDFWKEGTATWAEEQAYPEQDDFEWLIRAYFDEPGRPLNKTTTNPGDGFPYGTAIFAQFLSERFEPDVIRQIWGQCEHIGDRDLDALEAVDAVLVAEYETDFGTAFWEFALWNLWTRSRAGDVGYANAAEYPLVPIEALNGSTDSGYETQVQANSTQYFWLQFPDGGPWNLTVEGEAWVTVFDTSAEPSVAYQPLEETTGIVLDGTSYFLVLVNPNISKRYKYDMTLTWAQWEEPVESGADAGDVSGFDGGSDSAEGSSDDGGCGCGQVPVKTPESVVFFAIVAVIGAVVRRRAMGCR